MDAGQCKVVLTAGERQIAGLAAQGLPAKRIAEKIHLSDKTVRNRLVVVYSKLRVGGQLEWVVNAVQLGTRARRKLNRHAFLFW